MPPSKDLSFMTNSNGLKTSKKSLTHVPTCNVDGSERLVLFVIVKALNQVASARRLEKNLATTIDTMPQLG